MEKTVEYLENSLKQVDELIEEATDSKGTGDLKSKTEAAIKFIDLSIKAQVIASRAILSGLIDLHKKD